MSRWCEIVCDFCAATVSGQDVHRSAWAEMERDAVKRGWLVTEWPAGAPNHLCPKCSQGDA